MQGTKVLAVIGPTASGKTDISLHLCKLIKEKLNKIPEIISADSRQVYKGITIASSQPPAEFQKKYKHYFVNELDPDIEFNAGYFGTKARKIIHEILEQNKFPVIVGGSGLYISSLVYGLFYIDKIYDKEPGRSELKKIRLTLYERLEKEGIEKLYDELKKVDSESASKMTLSNVRRIIRALEIYYLTGIPISVQHKKKIDVGFITMQFGIMWERSKLYKRINRRVDIMLESGLVEEITRLKQKRYDYSQQNSLNTVGVKEVFDYLNGKLDYNSMVELIKQNTRRFAKRQMTWFRKDKNIKWISIDEEKDLQNASDKIFANYTSKGLL